MTRQPMQRRRYWRGALLFAAAFVAMTAAPAHATKIERVVSKLGIEAWLVHETSVPLIAIDFAFEGGANQDPADKPGVGYMTASLLDEGAGDIDSKTFQERLDSKAIKLNFHSTRDYLRGTMRTLAQNRDEAFELLRLALAEPRFDADAVERIRSQIVSILRRDSTEPNAIAQRRWWAAAFPDHPYGRPPTGTLESVPEITAADLRAYLKRVLGRDRLKIAVVGDIDSATLAAMLDKVFGGLPAKSALVPVPQTSVKNRGERVMVDLDLAQTVVSFGGDGIKRQDPDFMAAYIVNHILGGGSFSSRLYREVREKRGLAYSVRTTLVWLDRASLILGGTATRSDRAAESLAIIEREIHRLAETGPTQQELDKAKSYLKGAYALTFDTSDKIAQQLVQIQLDHLGIDYIDRRGALIDAVTLDDVKRVAKRLLDQHMLEAVVGRPVPVKSTKKSD